MRKSGTSSTWGSKEIYWCEDHTPSTCDSDSDDGDDVDNDGYNDDTGHDDDDDDEHKN